jgi:hypothetical protein
MTIMMTVPVTGAVHGDGSLSLPGWAGTSCEPVTVPDSEPGVLAVTVRVSVTVTWTVRAD